jgi:(1->4)-alpha-D-glucan 1-alpha-D-glucosylmutase
VMSRALRHRRAKLALYQHGGYVALAAEGPRARNVFAFARTMAGAASITVVGRLLASATAGRALPLGEAGWAETRLPLPRSLPPGRYREVLTGCLITADPAESTPALRLPQAFANLPVAILEPA